MSDSESIEAVERMFDLVEFLREHSPATLSEMAANLEMPKSTVHRHLQTLHKREYVVIENGKYLLSFRFLGLGESARKQYPKYHLASKKVAELAEETAERAQFIIEEHGQAVFVYQEMGSNAVGTDTYPGKQVPIHASAAGIAILSQYHPSQIEEIVDQHGLDRITSETISSTQELYNRLQETRERGYSINDQGVVEGLRALGAPVVGPEGDVVGGLSISGPINRMEGERFEEKLPSLLLGATNELELRIEYE